MSTLRLFSILVLVPTCGACDSLLGNLYNLDASPPEAGASETATGSRSGTSARSSRSLSSHQGSSSESSAKSSSGGLDGRSDGSASSSSSEVISSSVGSAQSSSCTAYCDAPTALVAASIVPCASGSCSSATDLACPTGQVVVRITETYLAAPDSGGMYTAWLGVYCATVSVGPPAALAVTVVSATGPMTLGTESPPPSTPACSSPDDALTGLQVTMDATMFAHDTKMACAPLTLDYTPSSTYDPSVGTATLVDVGGTGGLGNLAVDTFTCPSGQIVTGVQAMAVSIVGPGNTTYKGVNPVGVDCGTLTAP